jgi:hypothetical protein
VLNWLASSFRFQPSASGASMAARPCQRPSAPTSPSIVTRRCVGAALTSAITPPELAPYSAENGPRSTSRRCAPAMSKCDTCPWPSGIVAGMLSVYRRRPRMPKVERAPKPRELTCRSCA